MDPYQLKNYIRLEPPIIYSYNSVIGKGNLANEFTSGSNQHRPKPSLYHLSVYNS